MFTAALARRALLATAVFAVVAAAFVSLPRHVAGAGPLTAPSDLAQALGRDGFILGTTTTSNLTVSPSIDGAQAIAAATALNTPVEAPVAYLGTLTIAGAHVGDENTPLQVTKRLVYAVQMTGLQLFPMGGTSDASAVHHELVTFVDAMTGEVLAATTVR